MTALELADAIQYCGDGGYNLDAATMLRQQQAEIERLTMLCDCMTTESNRKGNEIEKLKARCVACGWNPNLIRGERNDSGFYMSDAEHYKLKCESQQAEIEALKLRELTDEEIESAYWSLVGKQHEGKIASYLYNFARDILKKASEK